MTEKNPVTVLLAQTPDGTRVVKVQVRSKIRPSSLMDGYLKAADLGTTSEARHKVEVLGGALAEALCERFGDVIDPDVMAKLAGKEWDELVKQTHHAEQTIKIVN